MRSSEELQQIIGYRFKKLELLKLAVTHPSMRVDQPRSGDNQRLEFLGDAVAQLLLSESIFKQMPHTNEGGMTQARAAVASSKSMAAIARKFNLGKFLRLSRSEESTGGRNRDAALADVLEAILGAIYLDGGIEPARAAIDLFFTDYLSEATTSTPKVQESNPKGKLQEVIQDYTNLLPTYRITEEFGPDHNKTFMATVYWGEHLLGSGKGTSKKDAEIGAALSAIQNPSLIAIIQSAEDLKKS
jgi:ribonuclease-3